MKRKGCTKIISIKTMCWIFMMPVIVYLFIWKILPLIYTGYLSMTDYNPLKGRTADFIGIENYGSIFSDSSFFMALGRTVYFMVVATAIELILGLIVALLLDAGVKGEKQFRMIFLMPMVITPAVVGTIWYLLFHEKLGPISYLLNQVGLTGGLLNSSSTALNAIIISDIWHWMPFMFLLLNASMQNIDRDIYEAAQIDGVKWYQMIFKIKIPLLKGAIISTCILRSMDAFRIYDEIALMTGGGPGESTETTSMLIYKSAFKIFDMGYASALVVVLLIFTIVLYLLYMKFIKVDID